jgi:hypothetical protein
MAEDDFLEMQYEDRFVADDNEIERRDLDDDICNWCMNPFDDCEC